MAIIHRAEITPTKLELLAAWLPGRAWYPSDTVDKLSRVAACRFDDPAGEVGVEIVVVRDGDGPLTHVPMTYRGAPLEDAEQYLIGTMEHSVLGSRWVYDAVGDPVFLAAVAHAVRTGGTEAPEIFEGPDGQQQREPDMHVRGTGYAPEGSVGDLGPLVRVEDGDPVVAVTEHERITIRRVLIDLPGEEPLTLIATGPAFEQPTVLAEVFRPTR